MTVCAPAIEVWAAAAVAALEDGHQIAPFSAGYPTFSLAEAYRVTTAVRRLRKTRGETPVGRKIGFTNRLTWPDHAPMWGYVYDRTVHDLATIGGAFSLAGLAEPRIEPETAFRLAAAPAPAMDERALLGCIDAVAHGFEVVQSIFPDWTFTAPDAVAGFGLHGALLLGPWRPVARREEAWEAELKRFTVDLVCNGAVIDQGRAANVLGGPLTALRHLVDLTASDAVNPPLGAGEIVTTGTLTRVPPVAPGQTWTTAVTGIALGRHGAVHLASAKVCSQGGITDSASPGRETLPPEISVPTASKLRRRTGPHPSVPCPT
jgi:2-oxo-3-hexenedioate decarboxylase